MGQKNESYYITMCEIMIWMAWRKRLFNFYIDYDVDDVKKKTF